MLKAKLRNVLLLTIFLPGCSMLPQLAGPMASFAMGLYDADTYYSKECAWYEEVHFSDKTKAWIKQSKPDTLVLEDFAKVARNNDLFKELCPDGN